MCFEGLCVKWECNAYGGSICVSSFSVFCFSISSSSVLSRMSSSRLEEYCSNIRNMESMMFVFFPLLMFLNWGQRQKSSQDWNWHWEKTLNNNWNQIENFLFYTLHFYLDLKGLIPCHKVFLICHPATHQAHGFSLASNVEKNGHESWIDSSSARPSHTTQCS